MLLLSAMHNGGVDTIFVFFLNLLRPIHFSKFTSLIIAIIGLFEVFQRLLRKYFKKCDKKDFSSYAKLRISSSPKMLRVCPCVSGCDTLWTVSVVYSQIFSKIYNFDVEISLKFLVKLRKLRTGYRFFIIFSTRTNLRFAIEQHIRQCRQRFLIKYKLIDWDWQWVGQRSVFQ